MQKRFLVGDIISAGWSPCKQLSPTQGFSNPAQRILVIPLPPWILRYLTQIIFGDFNEVLLDLLFNFLNFATELSIYINFEKSNLGRIGENEIYTDYNSFHILLASHLSPEWHIFPWTPNLNQSTIGDSQQKDAAAAAT